MGQNNKHKIVLPNQPYVLVVDDEPDARLIVQGCLDGFCNLSFAANGKEAWNMILEHQPALIVLDLIMPEIDGHELLAMMNQSTLLKHTKVIITSAKTKIDDQINGLKEGAVMYLPKPFRTELLAAHVRTMLDMQSSVAQEEVLEIMRQNFAIGSYTAKIMAERLATMSEVLTKDMQAEDIDILSLLDTIQRAAGDDLNVIQIESNGIEKAMVVGNIDFLTHAFTIVFERAGQVSPDNKAVIAQLTEKDGYYKIAIHDSGLEMTFEEKEKLFFFNTSDPKNPRIALPLAKETALRHQGDLTIESGKDGSTFIFSFPTAITFYKEISPIMAVKVA